MNQDLQRKIALLQEVARQNRLIELRLKYNKTHNEQVKQLLKRQIENIKKQQN